MSSPTINHWAAVLISYAICKKLLGVEYCIRSMGIPGLSAFLMQIGQDLRKIEDPPQDIMSFLEEI